MSARAALPQAIVSFIYAKEYGLHVNVLSTAVIFGTIVSIPVLVAYYAVLDLLHV
ncbi:putative membrane transport protein [Helianthus annuus]|uniref:Membrane transport protein n=1 Tax=Helianthus annuus TaxID=4232 RepID=A0A9K3I6F7_HELAN|nr:putative membrane transport protein [Helianthus annuus]KAJ0526214.1 putative membrane transport protein [Helianthus annuus]KAJ0542608.1 putative membrane transport protein [Helianthus annuus]KAJ0707666.1 putative membrane transport protein [Helianthus annuus]KAJ0711648.1 putative membrane transport protein [Helianthus annuus]